MAAPDRSMLRDSVAQRAGGRCEYCRSPAKYSPQPFSLDHILPRGKGNGIKLRECLSLRGVGRRSNLQQNKDCFAARNDTVA